MTQQRAVPPRHYASEGLRPQTLLFTFIGHHIMTTPRREPVATSTLIEVLGRLGISAQAARSTLTRMVSRGYLDRHRAGRRAFFSTSPKLQKLLGEGEHRLFNPPIRELPDGSWTLLSFSIPEDQRGDRHSLRTALAWNGFGLLRNGLWIAPGRVDVTDVLDSLELTGRVEVFAATPMAPTDVNRIVTEAWELDVIAKEYTDFINRWSDPTIVEVAGALAAQVRMLTEWRQLLVDDPQLPARHLPADWPSPEAYALFRAVLRDLEADAHRELEAVLEVMDDPVG